MRKRSAPGLSGFQAVIFLGASSLSMMVAEFRRGRRRVLDVLSQPLELGRDVFGANRISRTTMDRCVHILRGYQDLLGEYRAAGSLNVRLLASNILLDIRNMDAFVNRLQISCGLELEVMDDGEMTRLLYLHMQNMLSRSSSLSRKRVMVLHVGPGNTRILLFDKGRITYYARYRMGAHRTGEAVRDSNAGGAEHERSLIREQIRGVIEQIRHDSEGTITSPPDSLVIFGQDFRHVESPLLEGAQVSLDSLAELADEVAQTPFPERLERYHEDYASVVSLLPAVQIYLAVAQEFSPRAMVFPKEEFAHAFLRSLIPSAREDQALEEEVLHFSQLLANRYHADRSHGQQVRRLCSLLFDQLQELHRLSRHDRLLLRVAAVLHEVGTYINPKQHHRHSQYIILNSEIFGLSRDDIEIVGLLARYHRHGAPTTDERSYAELELQDRLRVQKLAALLRVADALERAHSRRITSFSVRFANRRLELLVPQERALTNDNLALRSKADLFTDIFGYEIFLVTAAPPLGEEVE